MRNTLICIVGTSLFKVNLKNLSENTPSKPDNWLLVKKYYDEKNLKLLVKELSKVNLSSRICGAVINTIGEVKEKDD